MTMNQSIKRTVVRCVLIGALLAADMAIAQSEPTLAQVYATAQAGNLEQAQVMMQQVLVAHPGSARAHFVQAELSARQGKLGRAREALASAEKLSPGLSFAKPEAVQALRSQLAAASAAPARSQPSNRAVSMPPPPAPASTFSWGLPLLLAGLAIALGYFMFRKKPQNSFEPQPAYANQGGLTGAQSFGMGNNPGAGTMATPYGQPGASGLGGKVMGGLATGLAVGAGVMAAQAIGRSLMGNHDQSGREPDHFANNDTQALSSNPDMGGQNFGINDTGSWDDGASMDSGGGGGDWDN